jgi:shikimate dehydrogenase
MAAARYGLIGHPVAHSLSPAMYRAAFAACGIDADYQLRPTRPDQLDDVFKELAAGRWAGLNVTTPLKTLVAARVDRDALAHRAGAVNTLVQQQNRWTGYLTDVAGITAPLRRLEVGPGRGLVLGAGGAARAAVLALEELGMEAAVAARRLEAAQQLLADLHPALPGLALSLGNQPQLEQLFPELTVLIQATPNASPEAWASLPWPKARPELVAFEMIYWPRQTPFLGHAQRHQLRFVEGWHMLVHQAVEAFSLWTDLPAPLQVMQKAALNALA